MCNSSGEPHGVFARRVLLARTHFKESGEAGTVPTPRIPPDSRHRDATGPTRGRWVAGGLRPPLCRRGRRVPRSRLLFGPGSGSVAFGREESTQDTVPPATGHSPGHPDPPSPSAERPRPLTHGEWGKLGHAQREPRPVLSHPPTMSRSLHNQATGRVPGAGHGAWPRCRGGRAGSSGRPAAPRPLPRPAAPPPGSRLAPPPRSRPAPLCGFGLFQRGP